MNVDVSYNLFGHQYYSASREVTDSLVKLSK